MCLAFLVLLGALNLYNSKDILCISISLFRPEQTIQVIYFMQTSLHLCNNYVPFSHYVTVLDNIIINYCHYPVSTNAHFIKPYRSPVHLLAGSR